jgi:nitrous oxidase accessory protein
MKRTALALTIVLSLLISLTVVAQSAKSSTKTIVVPDDYPTIAFAIGNATEGDTIFVKNGIYLEHSLIINKSIALIGENSNDTIIKNIDEPVQFLGSSLFIGPTAIGIFADYVKISGFTISSSGTAIGGGGVRTLITMNNLNGGYGISLDQGSYQTIADNIITSINCHAPFTYIVNNTLRASYSVLTVQTPSSNNVIYGNNLVGFNTTSNLNVAGIDGINVYDSNNNFMIKNNISNCSVGILIDLSSLSNYVVGNTISNGFVGLATIRGSSDNIACANTVVSNTAAIAIAGSSNLFYRNNFLHNLQPIESPDKIWGPTPSSSTALWDNGNQGNFWNDYLTKYPNAKEVDKMGTGNTPYVIDADNIDQHPLMSEFNQTPIVNLPQWLPPLLTFLSPEHQQYNEDKIALVFTVNKQVTSLCYNIDWMENISTIGNTTVGNMTNGLHSVTLYANDTYGNTFSQTVTFTIEKPETFPIIWIVAVASGASIAAVAAGVAVWKKRKREVEPS